jgi:hypothetical protein
VRRGRGAGGPLPRVPGPGRAGDEGRLGLLGCAREVLGLYMERPDSLALSDWEKRDLDVAQVMVACVDAYVAYRLGERVLGD